MLPLTNRIKVWRYFKVLAIEANDFAFVIKVLLGLERTCPGCWMGKIGVNDPMTNRVKV